MTAFSEAQEDRDRLSAVDGAVGDECRRWVTCTRCGWESPEHRYMWERDDEERYHELSGCTAVVPTECLDVDLNLWRYPVPMFTHRTEPLAGAPTIPARTMYDRVPFSPHHHGSVIYTDVPKDAA